MKTQPIDCSELPDASLYSYVDGELVGEERDEVTAHLGACAACAHTVRIQRSLKGAVRRSGGEHPAPAALRETLRLRLAEEVPQGRWARVLREPRGVALSAAAVGAAVWFLAGGLRHPLFARSPLLEDGVAMHARALPLDYTGSDVSGAQRWLEGKIDFGARLPRFPQGPQLQGVRLSHLNSRQAAVVSYTVPEGDRRVSLVIVDDPEPVLPGVSRRIADRDVWVSRSRGYNVASWRRDEIVYSLISDLDERDVLALVQSAELR